MSAFDPKRTCIGGPSPPLTYRSAPLWRTIGVTMRQAVSLGQGEGLLLSTRVHPRNVAQRNVTKRYFGAPLKYGNCRSALFGSTFKLHCDKEVRATDIFVVPDFAAPRTLAIEVDSRRVPSWMTGTEA
jgi:hypothetical protein